MLIADVTMPSEAMRLLLEANIVKATPVHLVIG